MKKIPYRCCEAFVLRTPLFSVSERTGIKYEDTVFDEALFLASPEFYNEKQKYVSASGKKDRRKEISLYKFYTRACTRATPFGLFAGCSVGRTGEKTEVVLEEREKYRRSTRLDMNYLCAVVQSLEQEPEIKSVVKYYPNDSLYELGGSLRYVEYYYSGIKRVHRISSVEPSEYLLKVLARAKNGATAGELVREIADDEVEEADAREFVDQLIREQLLKSALQVSVTGNDPLEKLIGRLEALQADVKVWGWLRKIKDLLIKIDAGPLGEGIPLYREITRIIESEKVPFEPKFIFQTDLFKPTVRSTVSRELIDELSGVLEFLNKLSFPPPEGYLAGFKKRFYERYENARMPLLQVLDTELGIGYRKAGDSGDINPLVDDIVYSRMGKIPGGVEVNPVQIMLLKKYINALRSGAAVIRLEDSDTAGVNARWNDLPLSFSVICNILKDDGKERLFRVKGAGGAGAANMLGRFCHLSPEIFSLVKEIARREQEAAGDVILAEIVHLPESRLGNILMRPVLREYEINYLARPGTDVLHRIPLSDLTVSVERSRVVLRSISLGKEIIPRMSNAHNFRKDGMPVYHFLCDLQMQDLRWALYLDTGELPGRLDHFPRVVYKNAILSAAQWMVKKTETEGWDPPQDERVRELAAEWRNSRNVPRYITIPEGDNELFVDLEDPAGVRVLAGLAARRGMLKVTEAFLPDDNGPVRDDRGPYCGEFVFSFCKEPETN